MAEPFSSDDQKIISQFVQDRIGFSYAPDRRSDLIRGFLAACKDVGAENPGACLQMLHDPTFTGALEAALVKKLTIGETYFFRDKNLFLFLRDQLLPDLIRTRRLDRKFIRIWCAACSTGEEPYSLAILLRHLIPDLNQWDLSILGTDINPGSLHAAERGVYSKWSFREQAPVPMDQYVSPAPDGRFQLSEDIMSMVKFSRLNLISDRYPSVTTGTTTMDIVLCRNVLMYFSSDLAVSVVDRLYSSLIQKGWLIVSPQEISYAQRPGFNQIKRNSVFLFQKGVKEESQKELVSDRTVIEPDPGIITATESHEEIINRLDRKLSSITAFATPSAAISQIQATGNIRSAEQTTGTLELIQAGRLSDAEYQLMQIVTPGAKERGEMELLARAFADQGEIERSLGWCDRILGVDPLTPGVYHLKAVILQERGESSAAVQSLRQALYADPDYVPAHLMLGMIMMNQGNQTDARRHYQVALKIVSAMDDDYPVKETDGMPASKVREMLTVLLNGVKV
ncbi:MAG TPA: CheR family methyltransferase [Methanospirillum sp.]|nr:CheR family methyltransferase [Methanospirillum sp.]